jgi:phosphoserine phosphatase
MTVFRFFRRKRLLAAFVTFQSVFPSISEGSIRVISSTPITGWGTKPPQHVKQKLKSANIFCFDVDSTLIRSESIDDLAAFLGVGEQVQKITADAMGGSMNFTVALSRRLDLMRPSESDITRFQAKHPLVLTDGVRI